MIRPVLRISRRSPQTPTHKHTNDDDTCRVDSFGSMSPLLVKTGRTTRNEFPTIRSKAVWMTLFVFVWVFLCQILLSVRLSQSMWTPFATVMNNQAFTTAADPSAQDVDNRTSQRDPATVANDTSIGEHKESLPVPSARLRLDWTQLDLHSPMAKRIAAHQSSCTLVCPRQHFDGETAAEWAVICTCGPLPCAEA